VEAAGGLMFSVCRCQAIVAGPASRPSMVSFSRSSTIRVRTCSGVAAGFDLGRRERGSSASRPPCS
jgi:hypothetical protein